MHKNTEQAETTDTTTNLVGSDVVMREFDLKDSLGMDWFQGDFGALDEITLTNKIVKARKEHDCHNCSNAIKKGDLHRSMTQRAEGKIESFRWCQDCCIASILSNKGCSVY